MEKFEVQIIPHDADDTLVLRPSAAINDQAARVLQGHFDAAVSNRRYRIVVDLSETPFISSSGLGLFLGTTTILRTYGGDLILMNVPKIIREIFDALNLTTHFHYIDKLSDLNIHSGR